MSYGLHVYSKSAEILRRESLREKMNSRGWDVLFQQGFAHPAVAVDGPMEDEVIVGWRSGECSLERARGLIESSDSRALDELYRNQTLVGSEIWVECPYEIDPQELEDMAEFKSPEELGIVRSAKSHYSVSTAAGRTPASLEFQEHVARSIAELTQGWVDDPQSGESGTADEIAAPTPWQETVRAAAGRRPWYSIAVYTLFGAMGVLSAILGRSPLEPKNWYVGVLLVLGVVAVGLYKAKQWARAAAIGLSGILLALGILTLVSTGITLHKVILTAVHVSVVLELLSTEARAYFD